MASPTAADICYHVGTVGNNPITGIEELGPRVPLELHPVPPSTLRPDSFTLVSILPLWNLLPSVDVGACLDASGCLRERAMPQGPTDVACISSLWWSPQREHAHERWHPFRHRPILAHLGFAGFQDRVSLHDLKCSPAKARMARPAPSPAGLISPTIASPLHFRSKEWIRPRRALFSSPIPATLLGNLLSSPRGPVAGRLIALHASLFPCLCLYGS